VTTNDDAANDFIEQLKAPANAASKTGETPAPPLQIVINRPVRCTIYLGAAPPLDTSPSKGARR
jgi:hypothetical protein